MCINQSGYVKPVVKLASISVMLLLLSACTGFRLLPHNDSAQLSNNTFVEGRIRSGFNRLNDLQAFRVKIETQHLTEPLMVKSLVPNPHLAEFSGFEPSTGEFALRYISTEWEYIQIRQSYGNGAQGWVKKEDSWQQASSEAKFRAPFLAFRLISGPYSIYWEPPAGLTSSERMKGFNFSKTGISEVYEVAFHAPDSKGELQTFNVAEVWIDSASGLPVLWRSETVILTYELDDSIEIEPPLSD